MIYFIGIKTHCAARSSPRRVPVCGDNWAGGHVTQFWRENVDFNKALVCWSGATAGRTQAAGRGPGTGCRIRVFHFSGNTHLLHQITWRLYIQNCKYLNIDSHHHQFMCCCKEDSDFLTTFPKYFQSIPWERSVKLWTQIIMIMIAMCWRWIVDWMVWFGDGGISRICSEILFYC